MNLSSLVLLANIPVCDAHVHIIDPQVLVYPWLKRASPSLANGALAALYVDQANAVGIKAAVHIEAGVADSDRRAETESAVNLPFPFTKAVVGCDPLLVNLARELQSDVPGRVVGARCNLQNANEQIPASDSFIDQVSQLGEHRLLFELNLRSDQLGWASHLAGQCPQTALVLDHCGGPFNDDDHKQWRATLSDLSEHQNVFCKISGFHNMLYEDGRPSPALLTIVSHCIRSFGYGRVIWGSNWPLCGTHNGIAIGLNAIAECVKSAALEDRIRLFSSNARSLYRIAEPMPATL